MTYSRLLASVSLFVFALAAFPVQAQPMWNRAFGYQIAELLRSPDAALQEDAMRVFIEVADRQDPNVNLRPAARALLDVYATSSESTHRIMAVIALSKIDDVRSYTTLLANAQGEMNAQTRRTILYAVAASRSIQSPLVATAFNQLLAQDRLYGSR